MVNDCVLIVCYLFPEAPRFRQAPPLRILFLTPHFPSQMQGNPSKNRLTLQNRSKLQGKRKIVIVKARITLSDNMLLK